jgi:hypothetical protein
MLCMHPAASRRLLPQSILPGWQAFVCMHAYGGMCKALATSHNPLLVHVNPCACLAALLSGHGLMLRFPTPASTCCMPSNTDHMMMQYCQVRHTTHRQQHCSVTPHAAPCTAVALAT